jgi:hypothetical protein
MQKTRKRGGAKVPGVYWKLAAMGCIALMLMGSGPGGLTSSSLRINADTSAGDKLVVNVGNDTVFSVDEQGNVTIDGALTLTTGAITGDVSASQITDGTMEFTGDINLTGNISASNLGAFAAFNTLDLSNSSLLDGTLANTFLSGDVTLQGNAFNGADQLVQLTAGGALPALDGSALTNVAAVTAATADNALQLLGGTWASPGAIGSTTANTGAFTDLTANNLTILTGGDITMNAGDILGAGAIGGASLSLTGSLAAMDAILSGDISAVDATFAGDVTGGLATFDAGSINNPTGTAGASVHGTMYRSHSFLTEVTGTIPRSAGLYSRIEGDGVTGDEAVGGWFESYSDGDRVVGAFGAAEYQGSGSATGWAIGVDGMAHTTVGGIAAIGTAGSAVQTNAGNNIGLLGRAELGDKNVGIMGSANADMGQLFAAGAGLDSAGILAINPETAENNYGLYVEAARSFIGADITGETGVIEPRALTVQLTVGEDIGGDGISTGAWLESRGDNAMQQGVFGQAWYKGMAPQPTGWMIGVDGKASKDSGAGDIALIGVSGTANVDNELVNIGVHGWTLNGGGGTQVGLMGSAGLDVSSQFGLLGTVNADSVAIFGVNSASGPNDFGLYVQADNNFIDGHLVIDGDLEVTGSVNFSGPITGSGTTRAILHTITSTQLTESGHRLTINVTGAAVDDVVMALPNTINGTTGLGTQVNRAFVSAPNTVVIDFSAAVSEGDVINVMIAEQAAP